MIKNYFKIAWRNLLKSKSFSILNILGLAMGLACSVLIFLWVQDERNVDAFHANGKYIFQVYERQYYDGKIDAGYNTQGLLAIELKKAIPEIQYSCGMEYASAPGSLSTFQSGEKVNKMSGSFAGEDFLSMFSFPLIKGSAKNALTSPLSIAISRKMAILFFGSVENAMGKTIRFENKTDLAISAIFENIPSNSSMQFDFLRSWPDFVKENEWVHKWDNMSPSTYIQLRPTADPVKVESKIKDFVYRFQEKNKAYVIELALQSYPEKYLNSTFKNGQIDGGRIEYVRIFTLVALFILLIACINFMNLTTARAGKRAKEVGIRKVIGAKRSALVFQFIGEAFLLTLMATLMAIGCVELLLPSFNSITGKQISIPVGDPLFWVSLSGLMFLTAITAGSYPALFLSALKPIRILKGTISFGNGAAFLRKGLVVFQFTLSVILIVGMVVIYRQLHFIQNRNLGYERENLLYIPIEGDLVKNYSLFKQEATKLQGILSISKMRNSPTSIDHHTGGIYWAGKNPSLSVSFADGVVGYDFVKTMRLKLTQGRDFSRDFSEDSEGFLLNETAVKKMGFKDPIGQTIRWGNRHGKIIGVMKDFHFYSMHSSIDPLILRFDENWNWGTILIRIQAGKTKETIAGLEKISKSLNPKFPFTYQFSDLEFQKLYRNEQVISKLAFGFALLAILISCLGLFGLVTFTSEQRTKEIGIRKVLGASVAQVTGMLSKEFLLLVLISCILAFPVAWWAMNKWLQDFAYRAAISWWIFALAGIVIILIALLTVSFQAIKAALANPVKSLRTE